MNETIANGFMWWGIIVSAFWFVWITFKGMSVTDIDKREHDRYWDHETRLDKLEKKAGIRK